MGQVYQIWNLVNGKSYVGCTKYYAEKRFRQHKSAAREPDNHKPIVSAMRKYGLEYFLLEILEDVPDSENVYEAEKRWILLLCPEYNMTLGGDGLLGYNHTEETKEKIKRGNSGERHWNWGRKASQETRDKLSKAHKGKTISPEQIEKMRENARGNKNNLGRKFSEEHRRKISEAAKGRVLSEEVRRKISESRKRKSSNEKTGCH